MSQNSFFMAARIYGQWICHSPNVMKTDILAAQNSGKSGKSARGSIRFDSPVARSEYEAHHPNLSNFSR